MMTDSIYQLVPEKQAIWENYISDIRKVYATHVSLGTVARKLLFVYEIDELRRIDDETAYNHLSDLHIVVPGYCISKTRGKVRSQIRVFQKWINEVHI